MFHVVLPTLETLFASDKPAGGRVVFDWRLIRRKRHPFLLLPVARVNVRVGLALYSAQRPLAKLWRACLPLLLRTPGAVGFEKVHFEASADSAILQFLAQQTGVPASRIQPSAIKFGGEIPGARLVLLLCDETQRPLCVVKAGLSAAGRAATDREADLLEKLPAGVIGCIRMTGRLKTATASAFATAYFPGVSPADDAGMENLFHAWLHPGPRALLASLESWRELAAHAAEADPAVWRLLNGALAEQPVRPTLYHGDFAPWNIRAVNSQNLQTFDWERGQLQGIPGWDWFHFFVQTAILAKRHSVERAAAEVEQLLESERFKTYAGAAGISDLVQPLLLAYLLHQKWVTKPLEGGRATAELFELLLARWYPAQSRPVVRAGPETIQHPGWAAGALSQLKSAGTQLSNLFWEPRLTAQVRLPMRAQGRQHWPLLLLAGLIFAGVAGVHYYSSTHLLFLPLYLVPCGLLTWKIDRRWGLPLAAAAAVVGPLIQGAKSADFHQPDVMLWNMAMRFLTLQLCVLFVAQIRQRKIRPHPAPELAAGKVARNWAVVLASGLLFLLVAAVDFVSNPHLVFMPLYLLPCMLLTLVLNRRWGLVAALAAALASSLVEYSTNPNYGLAEVLGWNGAMRLIIFLLVVLLLGRIRRGNILFFSRRH